MGTLYTNKLLKKGKVKVSYYCYELGMLVNALHESIIIYISIITYLVDMIMVMLDENNDFYFTLYMR